MKRFFYLSLLLLLVPVADCFRQNDVMLDGKRYSRDTTVLVLPGGVPEQGLLEAVRADLAPKREIGVSLQVLAPETVTVNVLVTVKAKAGFSASQVLEAVRADLAAWFDGTMLGKDLLLAQIGQRIYQVEGVENYHIASPANDVTVERGQLPVLGTLAVEELV